MKTLQIPTCSTTYTNQLALGNYGDRIILLNKRDYSLASLVYARWNQLFISKDSRGKDLYALQNVPTYKITHLQGGTYTILEHMDKIHEGNTCYKIVHAEWEDGFMLSNSVMNTIPSWNQLPDCDYQDTTKRFLKSFRAPSGLLNINECKLFGESIAL